MEVKKELTVKELMEFIDSREGDFFINVELTEEGGSDDKEIGCGSNKAM